MPTEDEDLASLAKEGKGDLPSFRVSEIGYNGLDAVAGQIYEECDPNLTWPRCQVTYKKMLKDGYISVGVGHIQNMITNIQWYAKAPKGYEDALKDKVKFLDSLKHDMVQSWLSTITQISSFVPLGFSLLEIVPRYRLEINGSKYNDGLVGIKKLAFRSQDSIIGFEWKNKDRDLKGFWQRVSSPKNSSRYASRNVEVLGTTKTEVFIPIEKALLFRNNPIKDNPLGTSPLNSIYEAWKYKKAFEEAQAHGVSQDVHGLKVLYMPPQYMDEEAGETEKAVYEAYKRIMRNLHVGRESGLILPQMLDESGNEYFKFEVVSVTGSKAYDVGKIIDYYNKEILTALYADFLVLGQDGGGSFAMSESKQSVVRLIIKSKLEEIKDVFNHHLIPKIFKLNGWDLSVIPTFEYGEIGETTLDEFSKALQRAAATGCVLKTPKNINAIQEKLNLPDRVPEDTKQDALYKLLSNEDSKSGEGQKEGMGNGTGKSSGGSGDNSTGNKENA